MGKVIPFQSRPAGYRLSDFDVLECPICDQQTAPRSISAGPTVAYRCGCGRSWRINQHGEETHVRLTEEAYQAWVDRTLARP